MSRVLIVEDEEAIAEIEKDSEMTKKFGANGVFNG